MTRPYSCDLREAVAAAVLVDGMSCREAAEVFRVSTASVVRWAQMKRRSGSCAPKPMGGRRRIILLPERAWLRARLTAKPDLTVRALRAELLARAICVSYGAVWAFLKAERLTFKKKSVRRRRPRPGDKWHMDEVFIRIEGVQHYLWRAVDQDGVVLDILVQPRRDACAAKRFFKKLLKGLQYVPRMIVTDKLKSHGVAHRDLLPHVEHRQSRYLTDVFDKLFWRIGDIFFLARVTAWPRAGMGMEACHAA